MHNDLGSFTVGYKQLGHCFPNDCFKCKKWLGSSKNNISKLGSFKLLEWLVTFFYDGIQAQSKIKLLGWLANPILIVCILGKLSQEFPKNLGTLRNNYFLPKLLVTYGITVIFEHDGISHEESHM